MRNNRISNEHKQSAWCTYKSLLRVAVLALLVVALTTQGLPMSAIAEEVQANQVAQTNADDIPATNVAAAGVRRRRSC